MHPDAGRITQRNRPAPAQVPEKSIDAARLAHQGHTRRRTDRQQRAADTGSQRHQQPVTMGHVGIHAEDGKHDRDIVDDGGGDADQHIGRQRPEIGIGRLGQETQVAERTQPADTEHHAIKEHQRVPLDALHADEDIEGSAGRLEALRNLPCQAVGTGVVPQFAKFLPTQKKAVDAQQTNSRHHAQRRWQMQEVVHAHGHRNGQAKQSDHHIATRLDHRTQLQTGRLGVRNGKGHDRGRHQPVDERGQEKCEELPESHHTLLPDHQRRDIAKGTEGAAGIGRHHDIHAAHGDEARIAGTDRDHHCAHHQCRRQVVEDRGEKKCQHTAYPEQRTWPKAPADEPVPDGVEDAALLHGVHIGHRRQQEQQQLRISLDLDSQDLGYTRHPRACVGNCHQHPDDPGHDDHGLGFAQVGELFGDDEGVGHRKAKQRGYRKRTANQIRHQATPVSTGRPGTPGAGKYRICATCSRPGNSLNLVS